MQEKIGNRRPEVGDRWSATWILDACSVGRPGQQEQAEPDPVRFPARSYFAFSSLLGYEGQVGWRRFRGVLAGRANATETAST